MGNWGLYKNHEVKNQTLGSLHNLEDMDQRHLEFV